MRLLVDGVYCRRSLRPASDRLDTAQATASARVRVVSDERSIEGNEIDGRDDRIVLPCSPVTTIKSLKFGSKRTRVQAGPLTVPILGKTPPRVGLIGFFLD